jgi:hypothetical protein
VAASLFCRVLLCSWQKKASLLCEKTLLSKHCLRRGEILREAHRVALSLRHREGWRVGARRGRPKRKVDAGSRGRSLRQQGERAPGGPWSLFECSFWTVSLVGCPRYRLGIKMDPSGIYLLTNVCPCVARRTLSRDEPIRSAATSFTWPVHRSGSLKFQPIRGLYSIPKPLDFYFSS